ncbi:MAG: hypothetical protein U0359_17465 [Byssovorax sp.]
MKRVALAAAASIALLAVLAGCRPATFVATPGEYADYRETRLGYDVEQRLQASASYLARYPDGAFAPEVRATFERIEPLYFASKQGSVAGLEGYLRALPAGPHRAEAGRMLDGMRAGQEAGAGVVAAGDVTAKLDKDSAARAKVIADFTGWVERFLDADLWRAPMSESKASVIIPWSVSLPMPSCRHIHDAAQGSFSSRAARRCAKLVELPYAVIVNGAPEEREATLEIAMVQDEPGRPLQITIGGPDLFLRLEETFTVRAISPGDADRRADAGRRVADLVHEAFGHALSRAPGCEQIPQKPAVLELSCRGVRAQVIAGRPGGDDDRVIISPP